MKKFLLTLCIICISTSIFAASFLTGLQKYKGKEVYVYYLSGSSLEYAKGVLLQAYTDGVELKEGKNIYFINKRYIYYVQKIN